MFFFDIYKKIQSHPAMAPVDRPKRRKKTIMVPATSASFGSAKTVGAVDIMLAVR